MTVHVKSAILLFVAVGLGVMLGALGAATILNHRVDQLEALRKPGSFAPFIESLIEPTDEAQRAQLRVLLEEAEQQQQALRRSIHDQHRAIRDSLRVQLGQILTPEQLQRLDTWHRTQGPGSERPPGARGQGPPPGAPGFRPPGGRPGPGAGRPGGRPGGPPPLPADSLR